MNGVVCVMSWVACRVTVWFSKNCRERVVSCPERKFVAVYVCICVCVCMLKMNTRPLVHVKNESEGAVAVCGWK